MINPVWLRTFCTLVEVGSFTRTAEQLFMTQSGVSQHIRKLEDQLAVPLLVREKKRFALTEPGRRLYQEGKEILQSLINLEQNIGDDPSHAGEVRLMSPGSVGLKLYPHLLDLQQAHPSLVIDYRFAPNADVEKALVDERIDVGFMTQRPASAEVTCEPVAEEALLLVTPREVKEPSWQILCSLGFIDHPDGAHHAGLLLGANFPAFQHSQLIVKKGFSNQISLILEPVCRGLGFTVLPRHAVEAFSRPALVRSHRLANPVSEVLYLVTRNKRVVPNRVATVISEARRWL